MTPSLTVYPSPFQPVRSFPLNSVTGAAMIEIEESANNKNVCFIIVGAKRALSGKARISHTHEIFQYFILFSSSLMRSGQGAVIDFEHQGGEAGAVSGVSSWELLA